MLRGSLITFIDQKIKPPRPVQTARREDIQVLRALAVSFVVLFHSGVVPLPGGFLGVDIFFVISGFLITSHIIRDIDRKVFSPTQFYFRRAKRLLPATYCTLSFTLLAAYFLLLPSDWSDYLKQLLGGLTFTANIFLWLQTGYFEATSTTKPLLHLWSLSVEEQYYLLLPFLLSLATHRWRLWTVLTTLVLSVAFCNYLTGTNPAAAFFLLPSRAWELLLGSLAAELVARCPLLGFPMILKVAAFAAIVFVPVLFFDSGHLLADTLIVTASTAILLVGHNGWLKFSFVTRGLSVVGDWSYSIYLVHWPLFAFATVICVGSVPPVISACLIPASYVLGYLQYQFVEQPFRFGGMMGDRRFLSYLAIGSLILALPIPAHFLLGQSGQPGRDFSFLIRHNSGLDSPAVCNQGDRFDDKSACKLPGILRVALWGDSYAMHWAAGLASVLGGKGLVQITKSDCGPLMGISYVNGSHPESWAKSCISFNESALKFILATTTIDTVVLASVFNQYVDADGREQFIGDSRQPVNIQTSAGKLFEAISSLRESGKHVIVLAPPPSVTFDIGACRERQASGLPVFVGGRTDCNFRYSDYLAAKKNVIALLKIVQSTSNTEVVWPEKLTCDADGRNVCVTQLGQTVLYRDSGHLTYDGSALLARMLHLDDRMAVHAPSPRGKLDSR